MGDELPIDCPALSRLYVPDRAAALHSMIAHAALSICSGKGSVLGQLANGRGTAISDKLWYWPGQQADCTRLGKQADVHATTLHPGLVLALQLLIPLQRFVLFQ